MWLPNNQYPQKKIPRDQSGKVTSSHTAGIERSSSEERKTVPRQLTSIGFLMQAFKHLPHITQRGVHFVHNTAFFIHSTAFFFPLVYHKAFFFLVHSTAFFFPPPQHPPPPFFFFRSYHRLSNSSSTTPHYSRPPTVCLLGDMNSPVFTYEYLVRLSFSLIGFDSYGNLLLILNVTVLKIHRTTNFIMCIL